MDRAAPPTAGVQQKEAAKYFCSLLVRSIEVRSIEARHIASVLREEAFVFAVAAVLFVAARALAGIAVEQQFAERALQGRRERFAVGQMNAEEVESQASR